MAMILLDPTDEVVGPFTPWFYTQICAVAWTINVGYHTKGLCKGFNISQIEFALPKMTIIVSLHFLDNGCFLV